MVTKKRGVGGETAGQSGQTSPQPTTMLSIFLRALLPLGWGGGGIYFFPFKTFYFNFTFSLWQNSWQALLSRDQGGDSGDPAVAQPGGPVLPPGVVLGSSPWEGWRGDPAPGGLAQASPAANRRLWGKVPLNNPKALRGQ